MNAEVARRVTVRVACLGDATAIRQLDGLSASSRALLGHDLAASDRCCLVAMDGPTGSDVAVAGDVEVAGDAEASGDVEVAGDVEVVGDAEVGGWGPGTAVGRVVGYAAAIVQLGEAQVIDLVVDAGLRGRRIGSLLFDALLDAAAGRGAEVVTLEVAADNAAAKALYRRRGFVVEGRRPRYYPDGSDALIMWRRPVPAAPVTPQRRHPGDDADREDR